MSLPAKIGRYEVLSLLGQGAMGAVYKARDPVLDRLVALKTVNPMLLASSDLRDEFLERFHREAKAAGRLSHPHIVSVYDLGLDEATGTPFIVMEYVPGASLETVLKENPTLPIGQAMEMLEQVASAVDEAHGHGVIHRDIKPANVFMDARGRVKVGDFGVARLEGSELTQTGVSLGTPGYVAPEVVRGGIADARSDLFALGVLAYRLLTGRRPFGGTTREAVAADLFQTEPSPPSALRPEVPPHVSRAVMHALAKVPEERTPSAEAFLAEIRAPAPAGALEGVVAGSSIAPAEAAGPIQTERVASRRVHRRSRRWLLVAALVAAALALGVGAFLAFRGPRVEPAATTPAAMETPRSSRTAPAARRRESPPRAPRRDDAPIVRPPSDEAEAESGASRVEDQAKELLRELQKKGEERLLEELKKAQEPPRERRKKGRERQKGKKDEDGGH